MRRGLTHTRPDPIRISVTADDFGLTTDINAAVERAHRFGVLTSASLMVAGDAVPDAVERARRMPALCVGLHVVVVDGKPVLAPEAIRALVDRRGHLSAKLVRASAWYFLHPGARRQLHAEVRAQFEGFRATGLVLDHVDTHHHLILHPTVLSVILDLAREFNVRAVRVPAEPWRATRGQPLRVRATAALRIVCLAPWLSLMRIRLRRAGIRFNTEVRGLANTGAMDETTLLRVIATLDRDGTEIFCHPSIVGVASAVRPGAPVAPEVAELDALCSTRVRAALDALGTELVGMRALTRHT